MIKSCLIPAGLGRDEGPYVTGPGSLSFRKVAAQPAWNEALGLPRPWDQQWSLRIQPVLAYESDVLEYGDLFDGSAVVEAKTAKARRSASMAAWFCDVGGTIRAAVMRPSSPISYRWYRVP
jgi:hypothetical protein